MAQTENLEETSTTVTRATPVAVLFADIAGSTKLYEDHGDDVARAAVAVCIQVLTDVVGRFNGRVLKTIGDEVMCAFHDPAKALMASTDMQPAVQIAGEAGKFVTGPLRIKVGVHYGHGLERETDVLGEAAIVARGIINLAKADQVLTSGPTLEAVPAELRVGTRPFDRLELEGRAGELEIFEMIWEVSDSTQEGDVALTTAGDSPTSVVLSYKGREYVVNEDMPKMKIGRDEGNDIVVATDLTSRAHANVKLRRGRIKITDNSVNGTVVIRSGGRSTTLHREHDKLDGTGIICVGGTPEKNPDGVIHYACE